MTVPPGTPGSAPRRRPADARPAARRPTRRAPPRLLRLVSRAGYAAILAAGGAFAAEPDRPRPAGPAQAAPRPPNLECTNLRRLSDNNVLDLKLRFLFRPGAPSYLRLENAGRGWQAVGERPYAALTPTRLTLAEAPEFTAYVERLTGDYYHIDHTGLGVSIWGRCVPVYGQWRVF